MHGKVAIPAVGGSFASGFLFSFVFVLFFFSEKVKKGCSVGREGEFRVENCGSQILG